MNSDYDGQKETDSIFIELPITTFSIGPRSAKWFTADVVAPQGSFFTNVSITNSIIPGISIPNSNVSIQKTNYSIGAYAHRLDSTHYRLWVTYSNLTQNEITIPDNTTTAKVRFYVSSND